MHGVSASACKRALSFGTQRTSNHGMDLGVRVPNLLHRLRRVGRLIDEGQSLRLQFSQVLLEPHEPPVEEALLPRAAVPLSLQSRAAVDGAAQLAGLPRLWVQHLSGLDFSHGAPLCVLRFGGWVCGTWGRKHTRGMEERTSDPKHAKGRNERGVVDIVFRIIGIICIIFVFICGKGWW